MSTNGSRQIIRTASIVSTVILLSLQFLTRNEQASSPLSTLSVSDVTLAEDSCQNKSFIFTVTLSKLMGKFASVHYATSDGPSNQTGAAALANKDYVPVSGTLSFDHASRSKGTQGGYVATIAVPLGNHVSSSGTANSRSFTLTLSDATNATISKAEGIGTLVSPASSCLPMENAGCFVNYCGAATSCSHVNRSGGGTPYAELAGMGITPEPDPNFESCHAAGLWVDSDGDGLSDVVETQGYIDVNDNGINDPDVDVALPDADPNKVDVYLHYDYLAGGDHDHAPPAVALQLVVEAFAAHGVNLHIDPQHNAISESISKVVTLQANGPDYVPDLACAGPSAKSTYQIRQQTNFGLKRLAYHYAIFAHYSTCDSAADCVRCSADLECGDGQPPPFGAYGSGEIEGDDLIVSLGSYTDHGIAIPNETWAGVLMHELGHNLGLLHGGPDCDNYKPNYLSVMNYSFYNNGIPVGGTPGDSDPQACLIDADCGSAPDCPAPNCESPAHCSTTTHRCYRIDYSSFRYNDLNEAALDEATGLTGRPNSRNLTIWTPDLFTNIFSGPTNGNPIDWNRNGSSNNIGVQQDINGDTAQTLLAGSNDWAMSGGLFTNLHFVFQTTANVGNDGAMTWSHSPWLLQPGSYFGRSARLTDYFDRNRTASR